MVKVNLSDINVPELIADIWSPLNDEQREFLANHFTLQNYKKNEVIHCEGETPTHLMCLLSGKVKIYKDGVGGRSQIIRMIKPVEYFGYRPYFAKTDYVTAASAFEPSLVCQIPMTALIIVVLPEPLGPRTATNSLSRRLRLTPLSAACVRSPVVYFFSILIS